MEENSKCVHVTNLPVNDGGQLKVALDPILTGDNPWRTLGDYRHEQRRDNIRFWVTIASLITSIIATTGTAAIAISTITSLSSCS